MKKALTLCLFIALLPFVLFAQSSKKKIGASVHAATMFNYYSALKPYKFISERYSQDKGLILQFITKNSGTFYVKEGDSILIQRELSSNMPSQLFGIGTSIQVKRADGLFHEISLTKLGLSKSSSILTYSALDTLGEEIRYMEGFDEKMFSFGMRYELGKYFGNNKDAKLRFGISGGIEPSYYRYKRTPRTSQEFPLETSLITIDLALIPTLSATLSKKLSLDFKFIPNFLTADFGTMKELNPSLPKRLQDQGGLRDYKSPDMTWAFSILLRYTVKEAKKKRGED
ncbi:MAG: hypothetical protein IPN76_00075 [Saprospiraceae bacterium]|nr:hypothetical protein [Saprospiraceae bacterium]